jgi:hypothetical protein
MTILRYVKNADTVSHTWCGQEILSGNYYQIQDTELPSWQSSSQLLTAIATISLSASRTAVVTGLSIALSAGAELRVKQTSGSSTRPISFQFFQVV